MEKLKPDRIRIFRKDGRTIVLLPGDAASYPVLSSVNVNPAILIETEPSVAPQVIAASISKPL